MKTPAFIIPIVVSCALLAGCGVRFRDPQPGNEFFKSITVAGDKTVGATLSGSVAIAQTYAVDVPITCEVRQGKTLVKSVGADTVKALADGTPKSTPVAAAYTYDFTVDSPGAYKFECYTPSDQDNFVIREFTVR